MCDLVKAMLGVPRSEFDVPGAPEHYCTDVDVWLRSEGFERLAGMREDGEPLALVCSHDLGWSWEPLPTPAPGERVYVPAGSWLQLRLAAEFK